MIGCHPDSSLVERIATSRPSRLPAWEGGQAMDGDAMRLAQALVHGTWCGEMSQPGWRRAVVKYSSKTAAFRATAPRSLTPRGAVDESPPASHGPSPRWGSRCSRAGVLLLAPATLPIVSSNSPHRLVVLLSPRLRRQFNNK